MCTIPTNRLNATGEQYAKQLLTSKALKSQMKVISRIPSNMYKAADFAGAWGPVKETVIVERAVNNALTHP